MRAAYSSVGGDQAKEINLAFHAQTTGAQGNMAHKHRSCVRSLLMSFSREGQRSTMEITSTWNGAGDPTGFGNAY